MVKVKLELPHLTNIAIESMDVIFKQPSSMFMTMTAMDFIDKGIEIDCDQTVLAAKVACREMRKHKALRIVDEDKKLLRFRWFDRVCWLESKIYFAEKKTFFVCIAKRYHTRSLHCASRE